MKKKTSASNHQTLRNVDTWIIGQLVQALSENMEEQGETHVAVCAKSMADVNRMEVEL
jgi:hypothetical protein